MKQTKNINNGFSGIFIVIIFALLGLGIVLASGVVDLSRIALPSSEKVVDVNSAVEVSTVVPESDSVDDIDNYLNETSVDEIDGELESIDQEVENL